MTGLQAVLAHEAGHVIGTLMAGHKIESVRLGPTRRDAKVAALTSVDFDTEVTDLFGHVVAILMGPMAEGEAPPSWPPLPDIESTLSDQHALCVLANHLRLTEADYWAAVALAAHCLDDPTVKAAHALIADALGERGELTDRDVRDLLGPDLVAWLEARPTSQNGSET